MNFYVRVSDVDYRVGGPYTTHAEAEVRRRFLAREVSSRLWIETEEGEEARPLSPRQTHSVELWLNNDSSSAFQLEGEDEMTSIADLMGQLMDEAPEAVCQTLWFDRREQERPDGWRWIGVDQFGREIAGSPHER